MLAQSFPPHFSGVSGGVGPGPALRQSPRPCPTSCSLFLCLSIASRGYCLSKNVGKAVSGPKSLLEGALVQYVGRKDQFILPLVPLPLTLCYLGSRADLGLVAFLGLDGWHPGREHSEISWGRDSLSVPRII